MKNIFKRYWPLCTVALLLLAALCIFLVFSLRSTPEKAVEGYIRASLEYDADALLRYASDYQITALSGNGDMDLETLRETLRKSYEEAAQYREDGKIKFESEIIETPAEGTDRYAELLEEYSFKADAEEVDGFAVVNAKCYVDGKLQGNYTAVAVKCGAKWYYAFSD